MFLNFLKYKINKFKVAFTIGAGLYMFTINIPR